MASQARGRAKGAEYAGSYQKRTAWTTEEDEILKQQVTRYGTHNWPEVAGGLPGRTSKACSLRWRCFLSPTIIRPSDEPFSEWEIAVVVLTQRMYGNKWNDIAAYLPMRCNNDIKNHFNLYLKDKSNVFSDNPMLAKGCDLPALLNMEPAEVAQRRERLSKEKAANSSLEQPPLKSSRSFSFLRRASAAAAAAAAAGGAGVVRQGSQEQQLLLAAGRRPAPYHPYQLQPVRSQSSLGQGIALPAPYGVTPALPATGGGEDSHGGSYSSFSLPARLNGTPSLVAPRDTRGLLPGGGSGLQLGLGAVLPGGTAGVSSGGLFYGAPAGQLAAAGPYARRPVSIAIAPSSQVVSTGITVSVPMPQQLPGTPAAAAPAAAASPFMSWAAPSSSTSSSQGCHEGMEPVCLPGAPTSLRAPSRLHQTSLASMAPAHSGTGSAYASAGTHQQAPQHQELPGVDAGMQRHSGAAGLPQQGLQQQQQQGSRAELSAMSLDHLCGLPLDELDEHAAVAVADLLDGCSAGCGDEGDDAPIDFRRLFASDADDGEPALALPGAAPAQLAGCVQPSSSTTATPTATQAQVPGPFGTAGKQQPAAPAAWGGPGQLEPVSPQPTVAPQQAQQQQQQQGGPFAAAVQQAHLAGAGQVDGMRCAAVRAAHPQLSSASTCSQAVGRGAWGSPASVAGAPQSLAAAAADESLDLLWAQAAESGFAPGDFVQPEPGWCQHEAAWEPAGWGHEDLGLAVAWM